MAFFKSLFKKEELPPAIPPDDFPELYSGMKVEVLTPANALLFVGRLRLSGSSQVDVLGESGGFLPRVLYNRPVKLRCFQKDGDTLTLNGTIGPNDPKFWRIEHLQSLQNSENRNFFRQNAGVEGTVRSVIIRTEVRLQGPRHRRRRRAGADGEALPAGKHLSAGNLPPLHGGALYLHLSGQARHRPGPDCQPHEKV